MGFCPILILTGLGLMAVITIFCVALVVIDSSLWKSEKVVTASVAIFRWGSLVALLIMLIGIVGCLFSFISPTTP